MNRMDKVIRREARSRSPRPRFTRWQVAIVVRDGVVGFLPWPANRRWSLERSAVRRPRLRRSARKRDPSRDTTDTSPDNRGRTFYRVKRQLQTKSRARSRERRLQRIRRGNRVVRYASLAQRTSAALVPPRPGSARFGRSRVDSAAAFAYRSASAEANRLHTRQSRNDAKVLFLKCIANRCGDAPILLEISLKLFPQLPRSRPPDCFESRNIEGAMREKNWHL